MNHRVGLFFFTSCVIASGILLGVTSWSILQQENEASFIHTLDSFTSPESTVELLSRKYDWEEDAEARKFNFAGMLPNVELLRGHGILSLEGKFQNNGPFQIHRMEIKRCPLILKGWYRVAGEYHLLFYNEAGDPVNLKLGQTWMELGIACETLTWASTLVEGVALAQPRVQLRDLFSGQLFYLTPNQFAYSFSGEISYENSPPLLIQTESLEFKIKGESFAIRHSNFEERVFTIEKLASNGTQSQLYKVSF